MSAVAEWMLPVEVGRPVAGNLEWMLPAEVGVPVAGLLSEHLVPDIILKV